MYRRDIRVGETGVQLDFTQEPLFFLGVVRPTGRQHLQRFHAFRDSVFGAVNLARTPGAQDAGDAVIADSLPDLNAHHLPRKT